MINSIYLEGQPVTYNAALHYALEHCQAKCIDPEEVQTIFTRAVEGCEESGDILTREFAIEVLA